MEKEFLNFKSILCENCCNEFPKESYSAHRVICETKDSENLNSNNKSNLIEKQAGKNLRQKDDFGLESVKSLRERLDKRLKAISETMDSISKKDLARGMHSNRDRDRERYDFSSVEKKLEYFKIKDKNTDNDCNNILTGIEYENSNLPNFNTNETKVLEESNLETNLNQKFHQGARRNLNIDLDLSKDPNEFGAVINTEDFKSKYNLYKIDSTAANDYSKLKIEKASKSDIRINENLNENRSNNNPLNQEDSNDKLDFSNNSSSAAGIEVKSGNKGKIIRNYDMEENFTPNEEINLKNLINNEISKISHDNFNEEGDPISDNEAENFDIKRRKYDNSAVEENAREQNQKRNNYINIHDHEEDEIKSNSEEKKIFEPQAFGDKIKYKSEPEPQEEANEINELSKNGNTNKEQIQNINSTSNNSEQKNELLHIRAIHNTNEHFNQIKPIVNSQEKSEKRQNEQKNLNQLQQSTRLIHDDSLLLKIETTNKLKFLEAQRAKEELEKLESELTMMQRLTHEKWQIRKNAFKQIADLIITIKSNIDNNKNNDFHEHNNLNSINTEAEQELIDTMETLFPWFKYLISDTNVIALCEGLNSFSFLMDFCNNEQKNKALILFFDELEKLIMHSKNTIFDLSLKIILNALCAKKFANFVISEIIRKLNTSNNKLLMFLNKAIEEMLDFRFDSPAFSEHYLKLLFEKVVFYFSNTKQQLNKNLEKKKIFGKIIVSIFEKVSDDLEAVEHHLNLSSEDTAALEKLLSNANKDKKQKFQRDEAKKTKYTLYEPIAKSKTLNKININNADNRNTNLKLRNTEVNFESYNYPNTSKNKNLNELNFNSRPKENLNENENENEYDVKTNYENIDLLTVLPNEFFDIPYITALKVKKEILENLNKKLLDYTSIKDKDYKDFLNIINNAIDDTNILVNLEGIKLFKNFCRLSRTNSNLSKLKNLVISCYEKFKDKKTNVKVELFDLFNTIILNNIFPFELFFVLKLQHVLTQKNPIVKINLLEYVKETFSKYENTTKINEKENKHKTAAYFENKIASEELKSRSKKIKSKDFKNKTNESTDKDFNNSSEALDDSSNTNKTFKGIISKNLKSKTKLNILKLLVDILKEDSQSQVKDLIVEIILQIKNILETEYDYEALDRFEEVISSLPNHRINMIMSGKTLKNKSETNQNFEKEYKANLNRIKSSISVGLRSKSPQNLTNNNSRKFTASKERNSENGFRSNKNKINNYDVKLTETDSSPFKDTRKKRNIRFNEEENEYENQFNSDGYNYKNFGNEVKDEERKNYENEFSDDEKIERGDSQNINHSKPLEDKNAKEKEKLKDNRSLEKNKGKNLEREKNFKQDKIKPTKTNNGNDSGNLDNSLNYSNKYANRAKENQKQNLQRNIDADISSISDISPITNRTDRTNLEKKMDSAIEYISNLSEEHIFDYAKSVIRDFLIFIKKVTSTKNTKEDLECHFKVILKILNNIYNQMEKLAKKI